MRTVCGTNQTDFGYTGQRNLGAQGDAFSLGLMDYNARFYDPLLGRFIQPDTIVPGAGSSAANNRYAYVLNNPIRLIDPSGHATCSDDPSIPCALRPGERAPAQSSANPEKYTIVYVNPVTSNTSNHNNNPDSSNPISGTSPLPNSRRNIRCEDSILDCLGVGNASTKEELVLKPYEESNDPIVKFQNNPKIPDYFALTVNFATPIPLVSVGPTIIRDRWGNIYLGPSIGIGKSIGPFSFSYVGGWIGDMNDNLFPDPQQSIKAISGDSINIGAGVVAGVNDIYTITNNNNITINKSAHEEGIMVLAMIGAAWNRTFLIGRDNK